jgi:hypothetical protein
MSLHNFDPEVWHPVRIPVKADSRSGDFPPLDTFVSREHEAMTKWCEKNCRGSWLPVPDDNGPTVFWFEQNGDAIAFAMEWFPYKCI